MSTLSRIRASLFNKTESPPPSIRSTFHQAIQAGDYRKVQKLLDEPKSDFYKKPDPQQSFDFA